MTIYGVSRARERLIGWVGGLDSIDKVGGFYTRAQAG
jgi:hypothetical protein